MTQNFMDCNMVDSYTKNFGRKRYDDMFITFSVFLFLHAGGVLWN